MAGKSKYTDLQKIREWSCEEVQAALTKHDLGSCSQAVKKRDIDGEALLNLTEGKLAMWKQDLRREQIQKLSEFVVNINFYPEKYSDSADRTGLAFNKPSKPWGQPSSQNSRVATPPSTFNKPAAGKKPLPALSNSVGRPAPSNGFNAVSIQNKFNKPAPPSDFTKPSPPSNFNKPSPPSNFNKPSTPSNFSKPNPPSNLNKPTPPSNFNKPSPPSKFSKPSPPSNLNKPSPPSKFSKPSPPSNLNKPSPPSNFNKPSPPSNLNKPSPPSSFNKPSPPSNFSKPNPPNNFNKPATFGKPPQNFSRSSTPNGCNRPTPASTLQVEQRSSETYLPMSGRKSPTPSPVIIPTNKFTRPTPASTPAATNAYPSKKPIPEPPHDSYLPSPPEPERSYPHADADDDPEYGNIDMPSSDNGVHDDPPSETESWGTEFDDAEQEDNIDDHPPPPAANQSSLFAADGAPSLPHRPPPLSREPALPSRPPHLSTPSFAYPQPPTASTLAHLIGDLPGLDYHDAEYVDGEDYADGEEYTTIDELAGQPMMPTLPPRELPSKPTTATATAMAVPDVVAPSVPHREPFVIPPRNFPSAFGPPRLPDIHGTTDPPKLPPREPYLNRFPGKPEPRLGTPEDDDEYELIENREETGEEDYLVPMMKHAVSADSVNSTGGLPDKLRLALATRKTSLSSRPSSPMVDYRAARTPTLENRTLPSLERPFSSNQPQRPLPPPPDVGVKRASPGVARGLTSKPWYHDVDRRHGEEMLRHGEEGSFLLRPSARTENPLTLTLWYEGRFYNIGVRHRHDQRYALGTEKAKERSFGSVDELVAYYQQDLLMLYSAGEKTGSTYLTSTPPHR